MGAYLMVIGLSASNEPIPDFQARLLLDKKAQIQICLLFQNFERREARNTKMEIFPLTKTNQPLISDFRRPARFAAAALLCGTRLGSQLLFPRAVCGMPPDSSVPFERIKSNRTRFRSRDQSIPSRIRMIKEPG
jgi:hypothetical protein